MAKIQHIIGYDCEVSGANGPLTRGFISADWMDEAQEKFDRWLAAHDREVAAESWEEGFRDGRAKAEYGIYTNRLERNPYKNGETL